MAERIAQAISETGQLPEIVPGMIIHETDNFQVATDYVDSELGQKAAFIVVPRNANAIGMQFEAAKAHNMFEFSFRQAVGVRTPGRIETFPSLVVVYNPKNFGALLSSSLDSSNPQGRAPSVGMMNELLASGRARSKGSYTAGLEPIPNLHTRHLRLLQKAFKDEIPPKVIHSNDPDSYYKVRKNWWYGVNVSLDAAVEASEFTDPVVVEMAEAFMNTYYNREFGRPERLTTAQDIEEANKLIDTIWEAYGSSQV